MYVADSIYCYWLKNGRAVIYSSGMWVCSVSTVGGIGFQVVIPYLVPGTRGTSYVTSVP